MGILLREALRRLCVEIGWSYAVFWRGIGCGDQMHLVWGDGYCEQSSCGAAISGFEAMDLGIKESGVLRSSHDGHFAELGCQAEDRVRSLVYKLMATQVHVVGDGLVGKAALTGNHEWVLGDILNDIGSISMGLAEMNHQFLAGIQTVAIIPVLPHGIVQFGSTQMVMENIGFINHVKSLFEQLGCFPGALLSDITQKTLSQKTQLHAPFGLQTSVNQFGDVSISINSSSSLNVDNSKGQPFRYSDSSAVTQPSCALSTQLYDKKPEIAPEVALAKENITSTVMPFSNFTQPLVHPVVKPILRLISQLESGCQGAQAMFSNPEARLIENVVPHDSSSEIQYQPPVGLSSSSLTFLEEQLLSMSGIRSQEFSNNNEPTSHNSNMLQLQSHGCTSLNSLKDSDIVSSFGRSELLDSSNDLGRFSSYPSGATESIKSQCAVSSNMEVHQVLNPTNHLTFSQMFSRDLKPSHPTFIDKESETVSSAEKQKKDNDLFQALESPSTDCDEHGSCYSSLLCSLQDGPFQKKRRYQNSACVETYTCTVPARNNNKGNEKSEFLHALDGKTSLSPPQSSSGNDLFDVFCLDHSNSGRSYGILDDVIVRSTDANALELSTNVSTCITQLDVGPIFDALNDGISCSGMFSEAGNDQLLDAVVSQINPGAKQDRDDNASCKTSLTKISSSSLHTNSPNYGCVASSEQMHSEIFGLSPVLVKSETAGSSSVKSSCSMERTRGCFSQRDGDYKSQICLWVENGQNMNCDSISAANCKRVDEVGKLNRKRSRPGENPRPRPKDRQMIQDRVKELREIVPNGAKCSIVDLLEKTIKHMLFLQSVTKHADKLKETGEPKIISKEGGLLLKDNFEGGATWAFEVGSQPMICPIIVEDLSPPRQMLVEMLCEEQGLFLEIADLVRGLGLTILKGVMEARNDKVWARFAVEANRDVTRMEIFLSLVRLLEPTAGSSKAPEGIDNLNKPHNMFHPPSSIPATGMSDRLW